MIRITDLSTRLLPLVLLASADFIAGPASADVDLRVQSRPIIQPIDAYVLVSDGGTPVAGLTAADFSITLDGAAIDEFEFSVPPSQDPSQRVSIVVVERNSLYSTGSDYTALIDQLDVGDYVSVVRYWGDIEMPRSGGIAILPFTQIDDGAGSNALIEFLTTPQSSQVSPSYPRFHFEALLAGLHEFERPPVSLPDGPKAIFTVNTGGGRQSLSDVIAAANANSIPIFNAGHASWDPYPDVVARWTSLAVNTGGVLVPVAAEASPADAIPKMASWLEEGYRITIPHDAVSNCNTHVLEVSVGTDAISVPFVRCDTSPEPFEFPELRDVAVGTTVVSEAAFITGIETAVPVTVLDGEYSIGCGSSFTSEPGWIMPDESVCVRHTTAANGGLEVYTLLIVGGETAWFASSTFFPAPPPPPPPPPPPQPPQGNGGGGAAGVPELLLGLVWLFAQRRRLHYRWRT